jgi:hypothetical protein
MDASTHATKKGESNERRDDVKQGDKRGESKGRYEGGNDSDQDRQATVRGKEGFEEGKGFIAPPAPPVGDSRMEEEE